MRQEKRREATQATSRIGLGNTRGGGSWPTIAISRKESFRTTASEQSVQRERGEGRERVGGKAVLDLMRPYSLQRGADAVVIGGLIEKIIGPQLHGACPDFWKGVVREYNNFGLRNQRRRA